MLVRTTDFQKLTLCGFTVHIKSVAGVATCITFPHNGIQAAFDMGCATRSAIVQPTVFITHGHADHVGALHLHAATRGLWRLPPPTYYLPPAIVPHVDAALNAFRAMDGSDIACTLQGMQPGDKVVLKGASTVFVGRDEEETEASTLRPCKFVTCWPTVHRVASQGYIVWNRIMRLKEEHRSLSGPEIGAMRKTMHPRDLFDVVDEPLIAITGDTTIEGVLCCPDALRARLLVMEVTSVDSSLDPDKCRGRGHIHLQDVVTHADAFAENEALLFMHFSNRYSPEIVTREVTAALPAALLPKVHVAVGDLALAEEVPFTHALAPQVAGEGGK